MKIPKFQKLSKNQQRDFEAYQKIAAGVKAFQISKPNTNYLAVTLEEWYFLWDTHGIVAQFSDLQSAFRLTQAKDSLNLTINLWVEDIISEATILTVAEVWDYCHELPKWVWKSFCGQMGKHVQLFGFQKVNFSPDGSIFWPPWMLDFDPSI